MMDHWEKLKDLGKGGFGIVSLWRNTQNNKLLALKCCRLDADLLDAKTKDNWHREVDKISKLSHPNIIKIHTIPESLRRQLKLSSLPILCMEFCTKGDLRKELCKPENICGLPEESVRAVLRDVKAGIEYLHSVKIIHRDLKPENIVLHEVPYHSNTSTKIVHKLIDLGFAKEWNHSSLCGTFVGTLPYIAPELFTQDTAYSRSVDYWSLGLICHEIVTGFRPFIPDVPLPQWLKLMKKKKPDIICMYEMVDGTIECGQEIFPENHISQPLKYALEDWLRVALEWEGTKRGKSRSDNSLLIFSKLDAALNKKIVTVFCVSKLERLSYEIDESTLTRTLKQWVERDTGITLSSQLILLPSGACLEDQALVNTHYDSDPKLVAMLYVMSKSESIKLPSVETLQSKLPVLVARMLESPSDSLSYQIIRRTWANSVFFIQSIMDNHKAFIEAYSVKMLSLIKMQRDLLNLEREINSALPSLQSCFQLSKRSLDIDLKNSKRTLFHRNIDERKSQEWESPYRTIEGLIHSYSSEVEKLFQSITPTIKLIDQLQDFEEPGQVQADKLSHLLDEARKLYCSLIKVPMEERDKRMNSLDMVQLIFQLWEIISKIARDEPFDQHLQEVGKAEKEVKDLMTKMRDLRQHLISTNTQVISCHTERQWDIWNSFKSGTRDLDQPPPPLPQRNSIINQPSRIPLDDWCISGSPRKMND